MREQRGSVNSNRTKVLEHRGPELRRWRLLQPSIANWLISPIVGLGSPSVRQELSLFHRRVQSWELGMASATASAQQALGGPERQSQHRREVSGLPTICEAIEKNKPHLYSLCTRFKEGETPRSHHGPPKPWDPEICFFPHDSYG